MNKPTGPIAADYGPQEAAMRAYCQEGEARAYALVEARYAPGEFNDARKRMARTPHGATLIANPVSIAPGTELTAMEGPYVAETFPISVENDYVVVDL